MTSSTEVFSQISWWRHGVHMNSLCVLMPSLNKTVVQTIESYLFLSTYLLFVKLRNNSMKIGSFFITSSKKGGYNHIWNFVNILIIVISITKFYFFFVFLCRIAEGLNEWVTTWLCTKEKHLTFTIENGLHLIAKYVMHHCPWIVLYLFSIAFHSIDKLSFFIWFAAFYLLMIWFIQNNIIELITSERKIKMQNQNVIYWLNRFDGGAIYVEWKHLIKFTLNPDFEIRQIWTGLKFMLI